ncbi:TCP family transcription factor, putative isoform 2 [Hibiscus syriacus]|uniref:TCP family transcription factor, putative isoform 2 n=1 Tax=Hibiscus syriacus TaxID=106335 RepID=A0A6A2ZR51_HIBSY|nr:transcription factor TCP18-like [Hibiscus syriacus]KAE8694230.1 TCP family transcription factor, putative isoform 2 [Hibiscus syriacus]
MFPSNSNGNNDPIVYIDHSILNRHFCTDGTTPYIKPDDLPLSFFHFPSPCYSQWELELEDHDVFVSQHRDDDEQFLLQKNLVTENSVSETIINMPEGCGNNTTDHRLQQMPRRGSKTDRHSKINTANGPRDRRMRLSLDVAREFFGLQDMLGYDKASRTIEWLLIQSKPQIQKLINNNSFSFVASKSSSSTSEAEVVSGIDDNAAIEGSISEGKHFKKEKKEGRQRRTSFRPLARDSREKARERARARTKAKSMSSPRYNNLNKFGSWSYLETGKEYGVQVHNRNSPFSQADNTKTHGDQMIDESLAIMNKWWPDSIFNCLQNTGINQEKHQLTRPVLWQTMGGLEQ